MDQTTLMILTLAVLVALSIGGVGYAFVSGRDEAAAKRLSSVTGAAKSAKGKKDGEADSASNRRKQVQETLKQLEERQREEKKKLNLRMRLERAGLETTVQKFYITSVIVGLVVMVVTMLAGMPFIAAIMGGFAGGFGLPRWTLSYLTNRRQKTFSEEFANAVDVIVRGVKAGLPLNDCLKIIANESPEPVKSEFMEVVEAQKLGIPLEQALQRVYERIPLAEVNFFMIVLSIQQKTGGNLSEALGNLSKVLRDRKKMRGKIQAMSQEAKASAAIIGALPPGVMFLIYVTSPDYMEVLFTTTLGNAMIIGSAMWMSMGVLVMRKMINFDF